MVNREKAAKAIDYIFGKDGIIYRRYIVSGKTGFFERVADEVCRETGASSAKKLLVYVFGSLYLCSGARITFSVKK